MLEEISRWLADHSLAVQAFAAVAGVLLTAVLVATTIVYARITRKILDESHRARVAAEQQASAAQQQASAAFRSLELLQQQLQEQLGLGHSVVQTAIESAVSAITYWKKQDLERLAAFQGLPLTDNLVPANALSAVDQARRISVAAAHELSAAFDALRNAVSEIESMRKVEIGIGRSTKYFEACSKTAQSFLETAFAKIQKAQATLLYK